MRKLDIGVAWRDAMAMIRGNGEVMALLAGLFFLLPSLLWTLMMREPPQKEASMTQEEFLAAASQWFAEGAPWMALATLAAAFGSLAIWRLLLARSATVGDALRGTARQYLPYLAAMILFVIGFSIGWMLLIVPALFLYARLALMGPHMAASDTMSPIEALRGSWRATKGNAFWTLLLLALVMVVGFVIVMLGGGAIGALLTSVLGSAGAAIPIKVMNGVLGTILTLVLTVLAAAIYRQIGQPEAATDHVAG